MNRLKSVCNGFFADRDSVSRDQVVNLTSRNSFTPFLPYITYESHHKRFLLTDNTIAYMYELAPLTYMGSENVQNLTSALKQPMPQGTICQFVLYPDQDLEYLLNLYREKKIRNRNEAEIVGRQTTEETIKFLKAGLDSLDKNAGMPIRNMRSFVILKSEDDLSDVLPTFEQMLTSANLQPRRINDIDLVSVVYGFLNNKTSPYTQSFHERDQGIYNQDTPLRDYCIDSETVIDFRGEDRINDRFAACLTVLDTPNGDVNPLNINNCFGGVMGVADDGLQLNFPFYYSLNIIYDDDQTTLDGKASLTMSQSYASKFLDKVRGRIHEFRQYQADVAQGTPYVKILPTLWVFGKTKEELERNVARAKVVWQRPDAGKWTLQVEHTLSPALLLASLPGGLYNVNNNVNKIDRHFFGKLEVAATLAPVQTDFSGNGFPTSLFVGRKGQISGLDLFAKNSTNHNFLVSAESGGGKSFTLITILVDAYLSGDKVRVVDLGRSYEKVCRIFGGRFIDFNSRSGKQIINPLDFTSLDEEDYKQNITAASTVIAAMIYSKTQGKITEGEWVIVKDAVRWATYAKSPIQHIDHWDKNNDRSVEGTDAIYYYLMNYKEIEGQAYADQASSMLNSTATIASQMAFNMKEFTSMGSYGGFFVGKSTINISDDDFVVVELDDLKADPELFNVVVLQVMNAITQDLYLSDRQQRRFILFEEAATILRENGAELSYLGTMVYEGYRRARKYGGAFGVVLQSILDTQDMGALGSTILSNAAYKLMLSSKSGQYGKACREKVLDYGKFTEDILTSLSNNKPFYSEVFIDAPQAKGVCRLIVDPWRYLLSTTESEDVALFMALVNKNVTTIDAYDALMMIWQYRLNAELFQNDTKSGFDTRQALINAMQRSNVPESKMLEILR